MKICLILRHLLNFIKKIILDLLICTDSKPTESKLEISCSCNDTSSNSEYSDF